MTLKEKSIFLLTKNFLSHFLVHGSKISSKKRLTLPARFPPISDFSFNSQASEKKKEIDQTDYRIQWTQRTEIENSRRKRNQVARLCVLIRNHYLHIGGYDYFQKETWSDASSSGARILAPRNRGTETNAPLPRCHGFSSLLSRVPFQLANVTIFFLSFFSSLFLSFFFFNHEMRRWQTNARKLQPGARKRGQIGLSAFDNTLRYSWSRAFKHYDLTRRVASPIAPWKFNHFDAFGKRQRWNGNRTEAGGSWLIVWINQWVDLELFRFLSFFFFSK